MVCTVLLPVGLNSHYVEFFSDISGESSSSLSLYFEPEIPSWRVSRINFMGRHF